jgi:hypothetical protein
MNDHYLAIREIQDWLVLGNLDQARQVARWLAKNARASGMEDLELEVDAVRAASEELAVARDLPAAAQLAARLGDACANCHLAARAVTTFPYEPLPEGQASLKERMYRHRWAAGRMWEGLVAPSSDLWTNGARTLAEAPLVTDSRLLATPAAAELRGLAARVRDRARVAVTTSDPQLRARIHGQLIETCASCHTVAWPLIQRH